LNIGVLSSTDGSIVKFYVTSTVHGNFKSSSLFITDAGNIYGTFTDTAGGASIWTVVKFSLSSTSTSYCSYTNNGKVYSMYYVDAYNYVYFGG
jgi:hypothetical protein